MAAPNPTETMTGLLETPRLTLREFVSDDADFILEILNSPGWLTYIGDRNVKNAEAAKSYLEQGPIKSYREHGFGLLLACRKSDGKPVGMCGLLRRRDLPHPDLGFALLPDFMGVGYGLEMAQAVLSSCRGRAGLGTILAIVMPGNQRSIRLLEKTGFICLSPFSFPGSAESLLLYECRIPGV
ncbi:MAG TPA: GNAT family N-acetyltransferase [Puia sp.]|nr:GNAT family N-acetyltransferase [Puia sp.]